MRIVLFSLSCLAILSCAAPVSTQPNSLRLPVANPWYADADQSLQVALAKKLNNAPAKNIILMIGDGMSLTTVTAARIYAGQQTGATGEEYRLSFEAFPWSGLSKTYNSNQQSPDSAGTMTAMVSGIKTKAGFIGLDERATRGDCESSQGGEVTSLLEMAETIGKATGIVTNTRITHATPAANYAKAPEREWESDNNLPAEAIAAGCQDIAVQLLEFNHGDGIEVLLGGGRRNFLPNDVTDVEGKKGKRKDGRNLLNEWQQKYPQGTLVQSKLEFEQLDQMNDGPVLGLFNPSHMRYAPDRGKDKLGEPVLAEMTAMAIRKLQQEKTGFFLVVEGGRIDHAHHTGNAGVALMETLEFANAVAVADSMTDDQDTLIIVTADHSHALVAGGYATRGNPILGKVIENDGRGEAKTNPATDKDGKTYTTLGYLNGPGFAELGPDSTNPDVRYRAPAVTGKQLLADVDTEDVGYHQEALVPLKDETHSTVDVPVYAKGPGAHLVSGSIEQHLIFHIMRHAGRY